MASLLKLLFFLATWSLTYSSSCSAQLNKDSISFVATLSQQKISKRNDLVISLQIKSLIRSGDLKMPTLPIYGYKNDSECDIYFIVEKKKDSTYTLTSPDADYQNRNFERAFSQLSYGQSIAYNNLNLAYFYVLYKGSYRVKAIFRLSNFNKNISDVSTDWVCFDVVNDTSFLP